MTRTTESEAALIEHVRDGSWKERRKIGGSLGVPWKISGWMSAGPVVLRRHKARGMRKNAELRSNDVLGLGLGP